MAIDKLGEAENRIGHRLSIRDLSDEDRADAEAMLLEGMLPADVAEQLGLDVRLMQILHRMMKMREAKQAIVAKQTTPDNTVSSLEKEMQNIRAEQERMRMAEQYNMMIQRQRLDLNQIRIDQRRQTLEIEADYGSDEPEIIVPNTEPTVSPAGHHYDFNNDAVGATMSFFADLKAQNDAGKRNIPIIPTVDVKKKLAPEQINAELAKYTPEQIKQAQAAPDALIKQQLKINYPGISEENLKAVVHAIRHYVTK